MWSVLDCPSRESMSDKKPFSLLNNLSKIYMEYVESGSVLRLVSCGLSVCVLECMLLC